MKIVNTYDGKEYRIGEWFPDPNADPSMVVPVKIVRVRAGLTRGTLIGMLPDGTIHHYDLVIRYAHPDYPLQRVGFINT